MDCVCLCTIVCLLCKNRPFLAWLRGGGEREPPSNFLKGLKRDHKSFSCVKKSHWALVWLMHVPRQWHRTGGGARRGVRRYYTKVWSGLSIDFIDPPCNSTGAMKARQARRHALSGGAGASPATCSCRKWSEHFLQQKVYKHTSSSVWMRIRQAVFR